MDELKPCPFCGSKPRIEEFRQLSFPWQIICDCHEISDTQSHTCFIEADTKEEAIEAWNTHYERTCNNVASDKRQFECSYCGYYYPDLQDFKHCPECGARIATKQRLIGKDFDCLIIDELQEVNEFVEKADE